MASHDDRHAHKHKLGTLRLRHEHTNEVLLIPTPSDDPRDPLNWPRWYKNYVAGLSAWAIFLSTFSAAGPSAVLTNITISFFGPPGPTFLAAIAKAAYFITVCALMMGMSNLVWVPLMIKFGRRPVYIGSYLLFIGTTAWAASATSYSSMLAATALLGCAAGAGEVLGPLTISDLFFVHERGTMMVIYTCTLSAGTGVGSVLAGAITATTLRWQNVYWLSCALVAATAVLMFFTLPETTFPRHGGPDQPGRPATATKEDAAVVETTETKEDMAGIEQGLAATANTQRVAGQRPSLAEIVRSRPTSYTSEALWTLSLRPIVLIILPSALWASLVMAVSIGFLVAMSSNVSVAFSQFYHFSTWQVGLSYLAGVIGSVVAVFFGGALSDFVADYFTRRNGGIREPEMRLPAMLISLVTGPLALILYGVGIGNQLHWMCPVMGIALINFTIVQAGNISIVYMIDCYRPVAGEVTMTQYTFKSLFGFLLSFYTNDWISHSGYVAAFGEMAAISGGVFLFSLLFFFYGKRIRLATWDWAIMRMFVHWKGDREVGE
ncbi:MFS transporter [Sporothrix schenckii 1099-18]|uniref:Major facilitator superfamily (MFS) profile domain-containing protein n=2 Tax=Sporothrix schenckii TaxID=29908 RepID=U7PRW5_SPOS1|nr:MFS transporter [Sporothrix schenckii 1099-18]ERS97464.1 hypothetical protein HMPREF1624_05631 [Sporothrix schenckii ATCC 58251]KJR81966.1 MFS transporter [Sporothrix schenckii 1099-18]